MSSKSASPTSSPPHSQTSDVLTPSRKVQALLARFDDSDSDTPASSSKVSENPAKYQNEDVLAADPLPMAQLARSESEEEDRVPIAPRSRMTARLQGIGGSTDSGARYIVDFPNDRANHATGDASDSDDAVANPGIRRRLLTKRKSSPVDGEAVRSAARSSTPLFFPSPSPSRPDSVRISRAESESEEMDNEKNKGNSKFLALVEKHRRQRLGKEAAEAAKRAARSSSLKVQEKNTRRQRGSSPADDTDEDSDISGVEEGKKLSTQARPARKASKKAIEEMNRETQRMNRNMQLAHQARTKKKITKDSLLARFNFTMTGSNDRSAAQGTERTSTSSSVVGSDTEPQKAHDTPPTSPLQSEPFPDAATKEPHISKLTTLAGIHVEEPPVTVDKGKGRALSEESFERPMPVFLSQNAPPKLCRKDILPTTVKPLGKPRLSQRKLTSAGQASESDSDLEVVTSRGDKKKYAAFEQLPRRKAKEAPSHLALRSLAHLTGGEDRKHSMNAAEMEVSLRKAARLQARQERQQKIEELKAKGVMIQTHEEREREQQEVEDLLERARQEAAEIQKREKAQAKKEGNYVKDDLDDDDDDESVQSADFEDDNDIEDLEDSDEVEEEEEEEEDDDDDDDEEDEEEERAAERAGHGNLLDNEAGEAVTDASDANEGEAEDEPKAGIETEPSFPPAASRSRNNRLNRMVSDDEDDEEDQDLNKRATSPRLPAPAKTPQSLLRSARKQIPGLQMSDDLPIGLTQAFAATMAESQSQEQDSLTMTMDLPSPNIALAPRLQRLDSIDVITDSQPASQTQPLNINLSFSQSQRVPQSPAAGFGGTGTQFTPSQVQFEPTQDGGYIMSPFTGNRFATETPQHHVPQSTVETLIIPPNIEESPIVQRKLRLIRGRVNDDGSGEEYEAPDKSAFEVMRRAAQKKPIVAFDKAKSNAKDVVDEAAEESEDEYAGLGGASDEDVNEEENEHDREMIDEDTQVGAGDEAKLARLFADREREQDEAAVSKLLKDITTGALRRKRANDDLDLSDEEDAAVRRREAKRREFAKMRRELLKDEAVGKIAEDKKKEAFLRSIEDRELSDDDGDFDQPETPIEDESQDKDSQAAQIDNNFGASEADNQQSDKAHDRRDDRALKIAPPSKINQTQQNLRRSINKSSRRPATLAEIRESVSFLIEEPDSQAATIDLGLSDSEDEPEAYINLDRHLQSAEADENADDGDDLGDFIIDDDDDDQAREETTFKKPDAPYSESRAPFSERRTKERPNIVNRLNMLRQSSSSSGSSTSTKMAFYTSTSSGNGSFGKVPSLLRRATTNSSLGSLSGKNESVSATGVVTNKTERGNVNEEKDFVRKGNGGRRNAVNFRPTVREEKMSQRAGIAKKSAAKGKKAGGFLGGLFRQDSWT